MVLLDKKTYGGAIKPHKISELSYCKLTSEVHKIWRKHCPVNGEAGRWGVQLPFSCLHLQTVHFEMFASYHFSFSLTYLLVIWSYVLLGLPDFFWKLQEFWTMLVYFLTNFLGQLDTSLQSQGKKNEMSEDVSYPQTPESIFETMFRWLQFFTALLACYHLSLLLAP